MSFRAYGTFNQQINLPIIAKRAPTSSDTRHPSGGAMPAGQLWVDEELDQSYIYMGQGVWDVGGVGPATTISYGTVLLDTDGTLASADDDHVPTALATKTYVDAVAIAGAPDWSEVTKGIGTLSTQALAEAATNDVTAMTPLKVSQQLASGNVAGSFTTLDASGAVTLNSSGAVDIDGTALTLNGTAASNFSVSGAGIDLTLASAGGRVVVNGEEAAADAIRLLSVAGGLDADFALSINLVSTEANADSVLLSSAGGMDLTATGAAGKDIDLTCTSGSINLTAGENVADAIVLNASAGGMDLIAAGAAGEDIDITCTAGSVNLTAGESTDDALSLQSSGGVDLDGAGQVNIASSQNAANSIVIESSAGGLDILASGSGGAGEDIDIICTGGSVNLSGTENVADAVTISAANGGIDITCGGAAGEDIDISNTAGSVNVSSGEAVANALRLNASNAAGGIDVDCGTGGFILDSTGAISLDSAAASNFTATGAFDLTLSSTAGSVLIDGGEAAADAVNIDASDAAGGIDMDAGTGGIAIDTTGAVSLDGAAASNFSVSGAGVDLTLASSGGRVVVNGEEAAADALRLLSAAGGLDADVALQMNLTSSQNAADAIRLNASAGGIDIDAAGAAGEDITINNAAGSISLTSGEAIADSLVLSGGGGLDILAPSGGAGLDIDITNTGGSVNISASENAADAIVLNSSAGGMDLTAAGAAGEDIDITCTAGSVNITAGESVADAMVFNASGAAGAIQLQSGTGGVVLDSGLTMNVTERDTAGGTYAVLGSDYFITTDSTGGAFQLTLPASPATGRCLIVWDGAGQAASGGAVTISGNGNNIVAEGVSAATYALNGAYESLNLVYNGTLWMGQLIA